MKDFFTPIFAILAITSTALFIRISDAMKAIGNCLVRRETSRGVLAFGLSALTVLASLFALTLRAPAPAWLRGLAVFLIVTLLAIARDWKRTSVRRFALSVLLMLAVLALGVGRTSYALEGIDRIHREIGAVRDQEAEVFEQVRSDTRNARAEFESLTRLSSASPSKPVHDLIGELSMTLVSGEESVVSAERLRQLQLELRASMPAFDGVPITDLVTAANRAIDARQHLDDLRKASKGLDTGLDEAELTIGALTATASGLGCCQMPLVNWDKDWSSEIGNLESAVANARAELVEFNQVAASVTPSQSSSVSPVASEVFGSEAISDEILPLASVSVFDAAARGVEMAIFPDREYEGVNVLPGAAFWALLAIAAFVFWRTIERRASGNELGPVSIPEKGFEYITKDPSKPEASPPGPPPTATVGKDRSQEEFRKALLRNLPEAGSIPGGKEENSSTDIDEIMEAIGGLPGANYLKAAVKSVAKMISKPGGYEIYATILAPASESDKWQVEVRIRDAWSGRVVERGSLSGSTDIETSRAAGYWTAAHVISRSARVPGWDRWSPAAARPIGSVADFWASELAPTSELTEAVGKSPTSGVLLQRLANAYDLAPKAPRPLLEAFALYARAVACHPRFINARYRLAVSASMIADDTDTYWVNQPTSTRSRIAEQARRAISSAGMLNDAPIEVGATAEEAKEQFKTLAAQLLSGLEGLTHWHRLIALLFRRSERDFWWPYAKSVGKTGETRRLRQVIESARLAIDNDGNERLADLEESAIERDSSWQLCYNLACYYARKEEMSHACLWLERLLEKGGSDQVSGWIGKDPDMQSLLGTPRFEWVVNQLQPDNGEEN